VLKKENKRLKRDFTDKEMDCTPDQKGRWSLEETLTVSSQSKPENGKSKVSPLFLDFS